MKIRVLAGTNVIVGHRLEAFMQAWGRESTIYAYPSRATANRSYSHLRQCIALTEGGVYSSDKRWDKKGINDEH